MAYTLEEALAHDPNISRDRLERFVAKQQQTPSKVIGWVLRVRTGKNSTTTGTVIACEYLGLTGKGTKWVPLFKVTMDCGTTKAIRTFNLSTFHQQRS